MSTKKILPISLLHIFEKIFQTVIDNSLFRYFINNKLFTSCQSGFLSGNSCVSQLLSIINEIQKYKLRLMKIPLLI